MSSTSKLSGALQCLGMFWDAMGIRTETQGCECAEGVGPWGRAGVPGAAEKVWRLSLTCTHSYCVPRVVPAVVTVQAPMGVTDRSLCAVLPKLMGTHLTALTAIRDEADPQWAAGWRWRAFTWPLAELGSGGCVLLLWCWGEGHGCGHWDEGLWGKEQR